MLRLLDCIIRVPLDDESGFHQYNLHLCMLSESPYFRKVILDRESGEINYFNLQLKPNPKQIHNLPTRKSLFDNILHSLYHKAVVYQLDSILELIGEAYRFSLTGYASELWSIFAAKGTVRLCLDALEMMENNNVTVKKWPKNQLNM